jgi:hypothetical protein
VSRWFQRYILDAYIVRSYANHALVCGFKNTHELDKNETDLEEWVAIAGSYDMSHGTSLEVKPSRMKNVGHEEGLVLEITGGRHPLEPAKGVKQVKQKVILEMLCNKEKSGWEPNPEPERKLRKRDDEEEGNNPDENIGSALQFVTYDPEPVANEVWDVLRLKWETKYACEEASSLPSTPGTSSGWGFFTWMFFL